MKIYQVEHNNCEPYEDNFHFREQEFIKGDPRGFDGMDMTTIHELNIVDCGINIKKGN